MDSRLSDSEAALERLQHAIWHGDWDDVGNLAASLEREILPGDKASLEIRLERLSKALSSARASRAEMTLCLARLRAVSGFQSSVPRQNFAELTEF